MFNKTAFTRWFFIAASVIIIGLILWNTLVFFNQLKDDERNKMQVWAAAQEELQKISITENNVSETATVVIQSNNTTPMILYNPEADTYNERNIPENKFNTPEKRKKLIEQFSSEYKPIKVYFEDELFQVIYYGNSPLINKLKYYPAVLILIILLIFLAIYLFYQTSKSAEQNKLWAGMAKETAHQIGTPLSSLVGWTEILKEETVNPEYVSEIEKDVDRLKTITERFSKIGSVPKLQEADLVVETQAAFDYLKSRSSKLIQFKLNVPNEPVPVMLNPQLFGWTIENLVKNGIDAMKGKGTITISIEKNSKKAHLRITDTGKGISKRKHKAVFVPGYTTKKRGWGLGLSLAKRIIETYHNGKIHVLNSTPGKGTTMQLTLRLQQSS
ncbi:sensor histidine kinase [Marixanthomonas spongiae]|uniref:histidine kinase n=1 Tax=Marixanthomonas spongiae TaxID=2174845 RepID=A0A2U0HZ78_9FLAO|nr:HAMP domain-containing sensor histidine kinase [Marixanthomonas spongiae]PVW14147.1 two-component sensor histidine kinase [Marixanthomonas spongiae]